MIFGYFTLFVALFISAVAAYYSIVGLTAIFSAAVIPIVIMGASLEVGKVTAAIWLKLNWHRANLTYKLYLVPALIFLMYLIGPTSASTFLTSAAIGARASLTVAIVFCSAPISDSRRARSLA